MSSGRALLVLLSIVEKLVGVRNSKQLFVLIFQVNFVADRNRNEISISTIPEPFSFADHCVSGCDEFLSSGFFLCGGVF